MPSAPSLRMIAFSLRSLAAMLLLAFAAPASALTIMLEDVAADGAGGTRFSYSATLEGGEGLLPGSRITIYDFAGYVEGSIFTPGSHFVASTEWMSDGLTDVADDPALVNLVFTYVGAGYRYFGDGWRFDGFGASSIHRGTTQGGMGASLVRLDPVSGWMGSAEMTGQLQVAGSVPEPSSWAMMIAGFGLIGGALRRGRPSPVSRRA